MEAVTSGVMIGEGVNRDSSVCGVRVLVVFVSNLFERDMGEK